MSGVERSARDFSGGQARTRSNVPVGQRLLAHHADNLDAQQDRVGHGGVLLELGRDKQLVAATGLLGQERQVILVERRDELGHPGVDTADRGAVLDWNRGQSLDVHGEYRGVATVLGQKLG